MDSLSIDILRALLQKEDPSEFEKQLTPTFFCLPQARELMTEYLTRHPTGISQKQFLIWKNLPFAQDMLLLVSRGSPWLVISCLSDFADQPYAHAVVETILRAQLKRRYFSLESSDYSHPIVREIMVQLFHEDTLSFALATDKLDLAQIFDVTIARESAFAFVQHNPQASLILQFDKYQHTPYADELLQCILDHLGDKVSPAIVVMYYGQYQDAPSAPRALAMAAEQVIKSGSAMEVARMFPQYQTAPNAEAVLDSAFAAMSEKQIYKIFSELVLPPDIQARYQDRVRRDVYGINRLLDQQDSPVPTTLDIGVIASFEKIPDSWFVPYLASFPTISLIELKAIVARNMAFYGVQPADRSQPNVEFVLNELKDQRERYGDVQLFRNRNIVVAGHEEKKRNGSPRFATQALQDSIKAQTQEHKFQIYVPKDNTLESLQQVKAATLAAIRTTPPPFTFLFDGHGSPDGIYFSDGQIAGVTDERGDQKKITETAATIKITVEELVNALRDRARNFPQLGKLPPDKKDIFIFGSCYSHTFMRSLYAALQNDNMPAPITISTSEYGQYGFSKQESSFGSDFLENTLGLWSGKSTLGNVMDWNMKQDKSSPAIYIPRSKQRIMQLTAVEEQTENATA